MRHRPRYVGGMANPLNSALTRAVPTDGEVLNTHTELPARRAFVVQLDVSSAIGEGQFVGRVEHVLTGQRRRFGSLAELTAFMAHAIVQSETSR